MRTRYGSSHPEATTPNRKKRVRSEDGIWVTHDDLYGPHGTPKDGKDGTPLEHRSTASGESLLGAFRKQDSEIVKEVKEFLKDPQISASFPQISFQLQQFLVAEQNAGRVAADE